VKGGDTFIPAHLDKHLWIILSDPSLDSENVVIVNFTTHTIDEEQHCVVNKGDHPFVKHKTAVRYRDAKSVTVSQLKKLVQSALIKPNSPLSPTLLKRVRNGAGQSDFLPEGCRQILEAQELI
jgi:hypothetical protein